MRSVEMTFDAATDGAIRASWQALVAVGMPSLALHDSPSNRPHVTLAAGEDLGPFPDPDAAPSLLVAAATRPRAVRLGALMLFPAGRGRSVLVRAVVVTAELLTHHAALHAVLTGTDELSQPGRWTPHVTIARRLTPEQLAVALPAVAEVPVPDTAIVDGVRFWDGATKTVTDLG